MDLETYTMLEKYINAEVTLHITVADRVSITLSGQLKDIWKGKLWLSDMHGNSAMIPADGVTLIKDGDQTFLINHCKD